MTAPDLAAVERDLAAVLAAHGLTGDTVNIAVYPINQADTAAGWSVTGMVYTPPPAVPAPRREPAVSPLAVLADQVEAMS